MLLKTLKFPSKSSLFYLKQISPFSFFTKFGGRITKTKSPPKFDPSEIKSGISSGAFHDEKFTETYIKLLEGNKQYVEEKKKTDPYYFKRISSQHCPKHLLIGCADSRVPPNEMTKTEPGDIFIHRNIANQVLLSDLNCMAVLQYAVQYLKIDHIIVMGHSHCGGIHAANQNCSLGLIDHWLENIREVAFLHRDILGKIKDEKVFMRTLTELNVKQQVLNVCKTPIVQQAWKDGRNVRVSGMFCEIETGVITDLDVHQREWEAIKELYLLEFNKK